MIKSIKLYLSIFLLSLVVVMPVQANTPLHHAAVAGDVDLATDLVNKGANVNSKALDGGTPLHFAAFRNATNAIAVLITQGANTKAKNKNGITPLELARVMKNWDAVQMLEKVK